MSKGGAVSCSGSTLEIVNCHFVGNSAKRGGVVYCDYGNPEFQSCIFKHNTASELGGAIACFDGISATFKSCVFVENSAQHSGGGLYAHRSTLVLINCSVIDNYGYYTGGGLFSVMDSVVNVRNSIVWYNRMRYGYEQIYSGHGAVVSVDYSIIQGGPEEFYLNNGTVNWGIGNSTGNPMFAADYYHLRSISPCRNSGDPSGDYGGLTDIDGQPRLMAGRVDIGADEFTDSAILRVQPQEIVFPTILLEDAPPDDQILQITNTGVGVMNWTVTGVCPWLSISETEGQTSGEVDEILFSVDANGLTPGQYTCTVVISDPNAENSPQSVPVTLDVRTPLIGVSSTEISFSCPKDGPNPDPQTLSIWNDDIGILNWEINEDCNWLDVQPTSGQSSGDVNEVLILVDATGLEPGKYWYSLEIRDARATNSPTTVDIVLVKYGMPSSVPGDYSTIQEAIDAANHGDAIVVAPGTYRENINFRGKTIAVRSIDPYDWNVVSSTIIDANGSGSCVTFNEGESSSSVLEGFTLTNGEGTPFSCGRGETCYRGGGIYCANSSTIVSKCLIELNAADEGGGIYLANANPTISDCIIQKNSANQIGGGVFVSSSTIPILTRCVISENSVGYRGGGIYCNETDLLLNSCIIRDNSATQSTDGIYLYRDVNLVLSGCTMAGHSIGIYNYEDTTVDIVNSILWDMSPLESVGSDSLVSILHSNIRGGWPGVGNIDADPCFVDPDSNDFHLLPDSPCINKGNPAGDYSRQTDIDGESRVMLGRVDMGADEFNPFIVEFEVVEKRRIGRTVFEYDCKVTLQNISSFAVNNIQLTLAEASSNMTIIQPDVTFGDIEVAAGESAASVDTCTFKVDRSQAIDPAEIIWHVTAELADSGVKMEHTLSSRLALDPEPVGFDGLREIAAQWLWRGPAGGIEEDSVQDGTVNLLDFARLANNWLGSQ